MILRQWHCVCFHFAHSYEIAANPATMYPTCETFVCFALLFLLIIMRYDSLWFLDPYIRRFPGSNQVD